MSPLVADITERIYRLHVAFEKADVPNRDRAWICEHYEAGRHRTQIYIIKGVRCALCSACSRAVGYALRTKGLT